MVGKHDPRGRGHAAHRHILTLVEVVLGRSSHVVVVVVETAEGGRGELSLGKGIVGQSRERLLVTLEVSCLPGGNHAPEVRLGTLALGLGKANLLQCIQIVIV